MSLTECQLHTFSRSVLALTEPSQKLDPDRWLMKAVSAIKAFIPFDSAWWGQVETRGSTGWAKNVMHGSLGLREGFAHEWNAIAGCDDFARASIDQLGKPVIHNGSEQDAMTEPAPLVAFSHRHGLFHCLAITLMFPSSGLLFFISLYRDKPQSRFTETEAVLLEEYSTHLLNGWTQCLQQVNQGQFPHQWERVALTDTTGRVLYIGKQLSRVLDEHYEDWQGTFLPKPLTETLAAPSRPNLRRHRVGVTVQPCGKLASLILSGAKDHRLSPREFSAAQLYAEGQSYKEVARALGVTPATVRTYLRQAYGQLGVGNKVALAKALNRMGASAEI